MNRVVLLLLMVSMAVSVQAEPDLTAILGRWAGTVSQEGMRQFKGQEFFYTLDVHILKVLEHEASGTLRVLEVGCEAEMVFRHFADGAYLFISQPIKNSPAYCVPALIRIKSLPGGKIQYSATYATPNNPRNQGLQGTLQRLISVESKEQQEQ
jgi:hypothetical protein